MQKRPVLVWFRSDLRIEDNPALCAALTRGHADGTPVIAIYIHDPDATGELAMGAASRWWLHHSLTELTRRLKELNVQLVLRRGSVKQTLMKFVRDANIGSVTWNRRYSPAAIEQDKEIKQALTTASCHAESFNGSLLFEPWDLVSGSGQPYRVFTPFWKAAMRQGVPTAPASGLPPKQAAPEQLASETLSDWHLCPSNPDWAISFPEIWTPGEMGAQRRLQSFLEGGIKGYKERRNRPDMEGSSRLSPHLAFGEISPWKIYGETMMREKAGDIPAGDAQHFLSEVGWREFSYALIFNNPAMFDEELQQTFRKFPWRSDPAALKKWQQGQTGYPIVDAGMRQLWQTGWMHNRVRMIVGSFLVKHLLIDWRDGMAWFWDTLVDADVANNTASWQWIAGCGADAAPYFRVFNPILQGEKFDPAGDYVRQFVPELSALEIKYLHKPWEAPKAILSEAGIELGRHYPAPLIDHKLGRSRALDAYQSLKTG